MLLHEPNIRLQGSFVDQLAANVFRRAVFDSTWVCWRRHECGFNDLIRLIESFVDLFLLVPLGFVVADLCMVTLGFLVRVM